MTYGQSLVLGVVQGATEFLPVSSSGHLILVPFLFGWPDQGLAFDAVIHLGSLAALVAYFRADLLSMITARSLRLGLLLVAATVPAGLLGLLLGDWIERHLRLPDVVAASTLLWAFVMLVADRLADYRPRDVKTERDVPWSRGLFVGCAQALALVPGTSRSGVTITAGLLGGFDRSTAARFAFLLGIPITAAAGLLKTAQLATDGIPAGQGGPLALALVAAFGSGWASVWFLVNYLKRNSLLPFIVYRVAIGVAIFALVIR